MLTILIYTFIESGTTTGGLAYITGDIGVCIYSVCAYSAVSF